jgi:hypothetical protein
MDNVLRGPLTADKIVFLVTYDLNQAAEMDFILHVTDEGSVDVIQKG